MDLSPKTLPMRVFIAGSSNLHPFFLPLQLKLAGPLISSFKNSLISVHQLEFLRCHTNRSILPTEHSFRNTLTLDRLARIQSPICIMSSIFISISPKKEDHVPNSKVQSSNPQKKLSF